MASEAKPIASGHSTSFIARKPRKTGAPWSKSAGRLLREHGFKGVGLSELMSAAGSPHCGFYKQCKSKDDLVTMMRVVMAVLELVRFGSAPGVH